MNFLGLLVDKGIISQADRVAIDADLNNKRPLADALSAHGITLADALAKVGAIYGLPSRILGDPPANQEVFGYIPIDSALHYELVPLDKVDGALEVGIANPDNIEALDALQFISSKIGVPYKVFLITKQDFDRVIEAYKNLSGEIKSALSEFETIEDRPVEVKRKSITDSSTDPVSIEDTENVTESLKEDAPVTKIVSTVLRYATEGHASDVHIEPSATKTRIRFRVDGTLHTSLELPTKVHDAVVARIKILAKLRLDEKRKPQDGRFSATINSSRIDFRVSTFPTEYGEKVVMRILDQSGKVVKLDALGFTPANLESVRTMMRSPYGIILISGPTGSGKSTTLFAMLSELDREKFNVVSLEDPIEYEIAGVAQSQVRPEIDYTFANGLRSILRQDPDIIMVGEIRDKETAMLAVQAALTGHLVFSTIHTNTAAGAIPRLVDMGVDPFLIAPTLIGVIAQRLLRTLCKGGGKPFPISDSLRQALERDFADLPEKYRANLPPFKEFYNPVPTPEYKSGMHGRVGAHEILLMNDELEQVILKAEGEDKIYACARAAGMFTMREDAILKALAGEIPFREINTLGGELFPEDPNS